MSEETTMILEMLKKLDNKIDVRMDSLERRMDSLERRMDSLESKVDSLERRMDSLESKVDSLERRMDSLESKVDSLERRMDSLESKVDSLESEMNSRFAEIQITLENEIRNKINIIADGHLDLSRLLHDSLAVNTEKEQLMLRVTSLENDVRRIKEHLDMPA